MKALSIGFLSLLFVLAGAGALAHSNAADNTSAVAPSVSTGYEFNVVHHGHQGQLLIGEQEVTFQANHHSKNSMAWNYDILKQIKTDRNRDELTLVLPGGETQRFRIMDGKSVGEDVLSAAANHIAAAPHYGG
jgi:hypothetical protein